jgi:alpha-tubulin suppressor-like RCC1 family protein
MKNNAYLLTLMMLIVPLAGCIDIDDSGENLDIPNLGIISASQNTNLLSGHSCNIQGGGSASCWGSNQFGQIGDGTTTDRHTPTTIDGFGSGRTAVGISAGGEHTCAILDDGSVSCWGSNQFGQIGDGTTTDRHTPTTIDGFGSGRTAVGISAGSKHTCAILDDGSVSCWGSNQFGQIGDDSVTDRLLPVSIDLNGNKSATSITSGAFHTCAILDDGSVSCWGHSAKGQLGYGDTEFRRAPTPTMSLGTSRSAIALSLGTYHTCALLDDGGVKCWGDNEYGQLGDGTEIDSYSPSSSVLVNVMRISSSGKHSCAILNDGSVSCWGINHGQFGDGSTADSNTPVTSEGFVDGQKAVEISTGGSHTCVILDDNSTSCWGRNDTGQLGDGTTKKRLTPTQIFTNDSA